ncbi:hypothetical protein WT13_32620 [Burkholderia anthina]|nr:hypothetical protein WT13_32620 [Burkholderia anthina]
MGDIQAAADRERIDDHFPTAYVVIVSCAGELRDIQTPLIVGHACFRSCTAERAARCDEHREPVAAVRGDVVDILFQRPTDAFQFTDFREWRRGEINAVVEKLSFVVELVTQGADAVEIVDAQQVIRFTEPSALRSKACTNVSLQPTVHQHAPPPIGAGIGERTERVSRRRWILWSFEEADAGIELNLGEFGSAQGGCVVLEFETFACPRLSAVQKAEFPGSGQAAPVCVNGDGRHFSRDFPRCLLAGFNSAASSAAVVPRWWSGAGMLDADPGAFLAGAGAGGVVVVARSRRSGMRGDSADDRRATRFTDRGLTRRAS